MLKKPVLVTGGAGFVGGHLVRYLSELGIPSIVIDDLSTGTIENLPTQFAGCRFIHADVCNCNVLSETLSESSLAIHFAALVGMDNVVRNPLKTLQTNVNAVQFLAELCARKGVPLVNISSSAVYRTDRQLSNRIFDETDSVHTTGLHPSSVYAESKAMGELICNAYYRTHDLKCLIVRPFNLIGPGQVSDYGMVVPRFVQLALRGRSLPIYGDGSQTRAFSDVRQAVRLLWAAIAQNDWSCQVINLAANDSAISIIDLARLVVTSVGCAPLFSFVDHERVFGAGFIEVPSRRPSLNRLRRLVGEWAPIPLTETIAEIVQHESTHPREEREAVFERYQQSGNI